MFKNILFGDLVQGDTEELIQLVNPEDETKMKEDDIPDELGILPVRNTVLFPGVVIPITVGREKSVKLVKKAYKSNRIIGVLAQKNGSTEDPTIKDIYKVGTVAKIIKMLSQPDGNITIIIQGKTRFEVDKIVKEDPYITANVKLLKSVFPPKKITQTHHGYLR